jgi:Transposase DDE domain group 1
MISVAAWQVLQCLADDQRRGPVSGNADNIAVSEFRREAAFHDRLSRIEARYRKARADAVEQAFHRSCWNAAGRSSGQGRASRTWQCRPGVGGRARQFRRPVRGARNDGVIRADSGGGTHDFLAWLRRPGRRLQYSVGMAITDDIAGAILDIPARAWTPAYDADRQVRPGAWVAEITGMLNLSAWPSGMRVIVRKERPHPGTQLRFTDIGGHRFTCFATSTKKGQRSFFPGARYPDGDRLIICVRFAWRRVVQAVHGGYMLCRRGAMAPVSPAPPSRAPPALTPPAYHTAGLSAAA